MKASRFFVLGLFAGACAVLVVQRIQRELDTEEVQRLEKQVAAHLKQLESRLESKTAKRAAKRV